MSQKQSFVESIANAIAILESQIQNGDFSDFGPQLIELKKVHSLYSARVEAEPATAEPDYEAAEKTDYRLMSMGLLEEEPAAEGTANLQNTTLADFAGPINE